MVPEQTSKPKVFPFFSDISPGNTSHYGNRELLVEFYPQLQGMFYFSDFLVLAVLVVSGSLVVTWTNDAATMRSFRISMLCVYIGFLSADGKQKMVLYALWFDEC